MKSLVGLILCTAFIEGKVRICSDLKLNNLSRAAGSAGEDRQKIIKAAFKTIIDNIVPRRLKVLFNIVKEESNATFDDYK